ncbi:MAG: hypothetical protein M1836_007137 [Candelina mexicana]|nr:MAG: hypothetical protein M1836_007137 [Candelina mexicana]
MERLVQAKPVLLQIILESDLKTLLSLRLTGKATYDLITAYETSISKCVARRTFSNEILLIRPDGHPEPSVNWLLEVQYRATVVPELSALAVENERRVLRGFAMMALNIPSWDPRGDELRARVDNGWYILWHLSDIAVVAQAADRAAEPRRYLGLGPRQNVLARKQEAEVLARRLAFLAQLSPSQVEDYHIMHYYMAGAFDNSDLCDLGKPGDFDWPGALFNRGSSWLNWYVLRTGPRLFIQAWHRGAALEAVVRAVKDEWSIRSNRRVSIEQYSARQILRTFRDQERANGQNGLDWVENFVCQYWEKVQVAGDYGLVESTTGVYLTIK